MLLGAWEARAQSPSADALLAEGAALRRAHRDDEALATFERAWALCRCDEALAQRAIAEQALGRWVDAAESLGAVIGSTDPWVLRHREALLHAKEAIGRRVGAVELRADFDATVRVAGRTYALAAGRSRVVLAEVGELSVEAVAAGRATEARVVRVSNDLVSRVAFAALPQPAASRAEVIALQGDRSLTAPPRRRTPWIVLSAGAGALGVVGGALALWQRNELVTRYNAPSCVTVFASREENCGAYRRDAEVAEALAVTGFVLGGVGAVSAVVLGILDARRTRERARAWSCGLLGPREVGCGGAF